MNSLQVSVLLKVEYDHLMTALGLVKELLPSSCFNDDNVTVPALQPAYDALSNMYEHVEVLRSDRLGICR